MFLLTKMIFVYCFICVLVENKIRIKILLHVCSMKVAPVFIFHYIFELAIVFCASQADCRDYTLRGAGWSRHLSAVPV